jgi:alkylhydroperoxidase family enzyme
MTEPRLQPLADDQASAEVRAIFDAAREMIGDVPNLLRIVARSPQQARWLVPLMAAVQLMAEGTTLDHRLRELAILKTSLINDCAY